MSTSMQERQAGQPVIVVKKPKTMKPIPEYDESVVAAGKDPDWDPAEHPRGKDGKFIPKGIIKNLLTEKSIGMMSVTNAKNITQAEWSNLKPEQKQKIKAKLAKVASFVKNDTTKDMVNVSIQHVEALDAGSAPVPALHPKLQQYFNGIGDAMDSDVQNALDSLTPEQFDSLTPEQKKKLDMAALSANDAVFNAYVAVKNESLHFKPVIKVASEVESGDTNPPTTTPAPKLPTGTSPLAAPSDPGGQPLKITNSVIYKPPNTGPIAQSSDGQTQLVWDGKKYLLQDKNPDGSWYTEGIYTKGQAYKAVNALGKSWMTPVASAVAPADNSSSSPTMVTPTPVATVPTTSPNVPSIADMQKLNSLTKQARQAYWAYKIVKAKNLKPIQSPAEVKAHAKYMEKSAALDVFANEHGIIKPSTTMSVDSLVSWTPTFKSTPLTPPSAPVPVPPVTKALNDISGISDAKKKSFKAAMKDANVGYWSKQDKIMAVLKDIQDANPDPNKLGHSKYTPLQILTALDSVTKTANPNPYQKKFGIDTGSAVGKSFADIAGSVPNVGTTGPNTSLPNLPTDAKSILKNGDTSGITDAKKQELYTFFKTQPSTYLDSPEDSLWGGVESILEKNPDLTPLQVIRVIDEVGAQKVSKPNTNLFEKKFIKWLKTAEGKAIATGQPVPSPDKPAFKIPSTVDAGTHYEYKSVSVAKAFKLHAQQQTDAPWTVAERAALKKYTSNSGYTEMNGYLRGKKSFANTKTINSVKNAQAGMRPSTEAMLLHRGTGYAEFPNVQNHEDLVKLAADPNFTMEAKAFTSSSVGGSPGFGGSVELQIEAPPGTQMAYVEGISHYSGGSEKEMLIAAGTKYKIMSVTKSGYKSVVRVRIVSQ